RLSERMGSIRSRRPDNGKTVRTVASEIKGFVAGSNPAAPTNGTRGGMTARIYKPARTAMQSGQARTKEWVLDYDPESPREIEPLMGWTASGDMRQQVRLSFDTPEEAVAYCERHGIAKQRLRRSDSHAGVWARRQCRASIHDVPHGSVVLSVAVRFYH